MGATAQDVLNVMRSWLGFSEYNGKFKQIIDLYNSILPLPRGYAVKYTDAWCDATVSAAAIKAGAHDLIGRECGCEQHIKIFKQKGIWIEDGTIRPEPGDVIVYNWGDSTQANDGYADHIGYVEYVSGNTITAIEGNKNEAVERRSLPVGWGYIRGYAKPKYDNSSSKPNPPQQPSKTITEIAEDVIKGVYGNGDTRKNAIESMGYDYYKVQKEVNRILSGKPSENTESTVKYTVKPNDTLSAIASRFNTTVNDIAQKNGIVDPNKIYPGQVLIIKKPTGSTNQESYKVKLIKEGQSEGNTFCGTSFSVDGIVGPNTKKLTVMCLQVALNKDYGAKLTVDGSFGPKTKAALGNHYVKFGETQWLATFVQVALYIHGYDPKGVEHPGHIGYGCDAAIGNYQSDHGLNPDRTAGKNTITSLCYK
jgi:LysM repeat protein